MNSALPTISYMLTPTAVPGPIPPKPMSIKNTPKPTTTPAESSPATNTQETTKTDNTFTVAQKTAGREPPQQSQQFRNTLDEKVANEANETTQQTPPDGQEPNGQGPVAAQPDVVQQWLASYIKNTEHGKDGIDTEPPPKVGNELAQMLAEVRASKPAAPAGQPPNPTQNKPSTAVEKQPPGLNIASTKTSNTPAAIDNLPASDKAPVAATNSAIQQNNEQTSAETTTGTKQKAPVPATNSAIQQNNEQASAETTTGTKQAVANKLTTPDNQKTLASSGKESITEVPDGSSKTTTAGEKPAMAEEPAVSGHQRTTVLNNKLAAVVRKASDNQQEVPVSPKKSAPVGEKPTNDKAAADHQDKLPAELSAKTKEQTDDTSDGLPARKLNATNVHVSTGQTKDRSNSTSDNSNSNLEQVFSHSNAQGLITEQTSASSQSAKSGNNASGGDVTASISEQILESIHSSLRQGGVQQITIRLNPPELGNVFIKFQEQQNQIIGLLQVDRIQTRAEIQQALPEIIRNLADSGIQVKRLEVVLTNQSEQQTHKDQLPQDSPFQQQGFSEDGNPNNRAANDWMTDAHSFAGPTEPQMQITDNSINILM